MFTVVIPLFNKALTIVSTLESVIAQDYRHFEVVVVNDGSTDGGEGVIARKFNDPRIRILHQKNHGVGAARNRGVAESRYDWIAFLDADDILLPTYLSTMENVINEFPQASMVCAGGILSYPDGSGYIRQSSKYRRAGPVNFFANPNFFGNASSTIMRKSLFNKAGGFPTDMAVNEDFVLFFKAALLGGVVFCPELLSVYRKGIEGQVSARGARLHPDVVRRMNVVYEFWAGSESLTPNEYFNDFAARDLRGTLLRLLESADYGTCITFSRKSIRAFSAD